MIAGSLSAVKYEQKARKVMKKYLVLKAELDNSTDKVIKRIANIREESIHDRFAFLVYLINTTENIQLRLNQIACALALYDGKFVELATGEGKTYSIVLCALAKGLFEPVNIVTVNDYLAERDCNICKRVSSRLSIQTTYVKEGSSPGLFAQSNGIIYSSAQSLIFAYLSDGFLYNEKCIFKELGSVIIDEVDYVLIDNAVSSFSVSLQTNGIVSSYSGLFSMVAQFAKTLKGTQLDCSHIQYKYYHNQDVDFLYNIEAGFICLTEKGIKKIENIFNVKWDTSDKFTLDLYTAITSTLKANYILIKGVNYTVINNKIIMINQCNGRLSENSRFDNSLQLALETKENCTITSGTSVENRLSYQMFFSKFKSISGLSGTISECKEELYEIFGVDTVILKPNTKSKLERLPDIVCNNDNFINTVLEKIKNVQKSMPVLVICPSENDAKLLYSTINREIKSSLLVPTNEELEDEIILNAGKVGSVTISTILSTRGTDIQTTNSGGLFVLACFHSRNNRIDRQILGRTARNGKKGIAQFVYTESNGIFTIFNNRKSDDYSYIQQYIAGTEQKIRITLFKVDSSLDLLKQYSSNILNAIKTFNPSYLGILLEGKIDIQKVYLVEDRRQILYSVFRDNLIEFWSMVSNYTTELSSTLNTVSYSTIVAEYRFIHYILRDIEYQIIKLLDKSIDFTLNCTVTNQYLDNN